MHLISGAPAGEYGANLQDRHWEGLSKGGLRTCFGGESKLLFTLLRLMMP